MTFDSTPQLMLKNERVSEFNRWRERGLPIRFGGDHFSELDLRAVDLSPGYLSETSFSLSILDEARFQRATLIRADFTNTSLRSADLSRANVSEATFEGAQMQGANLADGIALRVELSGVDMTDANVAGLRMDEATYQRFQVAIGVAENHDLLIRDR